MDDKSAFDILMDYAKERGLEFETHRGRQKFYTDSGTAFLNTKYILLRKNGFLICAYDNFDSKSSTSQPFTGIYSPIELHKDFECRIIKKHWLDFLLSSNKKKTGIKSIDECFTITTKAREIPQAFTDTSIFALIANIQNFIQPIELLVQNNHLPLIKELEGKKILGFETNQWLYKTEDLDCLLDKGSELLSAILKS